MSTTVTNTSVGRVTVSCASGQVALGGGGTVSNSSIDGSYPSNSSGTATPSGQQASSWSVLWSSSSRQNVSAYAICAPQ